MNVLCLRAATMECISIWREFCVCVCCSQKSWRSCAFCGSDKNGTISHFRALKRKPKFSRAHKTLRIVIVDAFLRGVDDLCVPFVSNTVIGTISPPSDTLPCTPKARRESSYAVEKQMKKSAGYGSGYPARELQAV